MAKASKPKRTTSHKTRSKKGKTPPQLKKYLFKKSGATTNKKKSTGKKPPKSKVTVTVNGKTVHKSG